MKIAVYNEDSSPPLDDVPYLVDRLHKGLIAASPADKAKLLRLLDSLVPGPAVTPMPTVAVTVDAAQGAAQGVAVKVVARETRRREMRERRRGQAAVVFTYWQAIMNKPGARFDGKRERRICERLDENDGDLSELCFAIDGAGRDDFLMGRSGGRSYNGIETIFRDRAQVERLAELVKSYRYGMEHPFVTQSAAAIMDAIQQGEGAA